MTALTRFVSVSQHLYFREVKVVPPLPGYLKVDEKGTLVCSFIVIQTHF
jgi:hypothetical protein